ncbi:MAG: AAA family ATPase [Desulfobacula sp.]|nr:AAA family ATPase [Desulfobacula sp.]
MYTSFYNLHSKPFQISADPAFMWFGEKHKEALATLKYGILDNKGFLLLTGDVGTGKTSLINSLIESLSEDIVCTSVPDPSLEKMDFLNYIALAFGMDREFSTKGAFLIHFKKFLMEADKKNKKVLLIIDESQLLTQEMLEEIRLLSNIEKTNAKLINIFFVGQNEFNEILNQQKNRAVRQRLTLNYNIDPLTPDETDEYIKHRLKVAGTTQTIFDTSAVQEIFMYSGGFPRRINIICDHSLLSGYVKEKKQINRHIVRECAKELKIPAHVRNRDINGFSDHHSKPAPVIKPQTYIPLPKKPPNTQKKGRSTMVLGILVSLVVIFLWFFIFPDHFKQSVSATNDRLIVLKNQIMPLIPDSLKTYFKSSYSELNQAPEKPTPMVKGNIDETVNFQNQEIKEIILKPVPAEIIKTDVQIKPVEAIKSTEALSVQPIQENIIHRNSTQAINPEPINSMPEPVLTNQPVTEVENNPIEFEIEKIIPPLPKDKVIVRFKYNTNDFTDPGFEILKSFAEILAMNPEAKVLISGYTDSEGYNKYNRKLSEFRANIVKSFLLGKGAMPDQMEIKGLGSENPIESNNTAWGRMMNRRVEIEVVE